MRTSFICFMLLLLGVVTCAQKEKVEKDGIMGKVTIEEVYQSCPRFWKEAEKYRPDHNIVSKLRIIPRHITFRVFLGTWCSDSEKHVPPFDKLMSEANNPYFTVEYIGVNRQMCDGIRMAKSYNIQYVPTFILIENNTEIGRIVETPAMSIGEDILSILEEGV